MTDEITHWDGPPLEAWQPWTPQEAAALLAGVGVPWYVVGGWAIDLYLGFESREHEDLEISILREDFPVIRSRLADFRFHVAGDGEVRELGLDALPPPDKYQNWVLDVDANKWRVDIMLSPGDRDTWICRRDASITVPRREIIGSRDGIDYLKPEAVLMFKAKYKREKDMADLQACLPRLAPSARRWLRQVLDRIHPGHEWLEIV